MEPAGVCARPNSPIKFGNQKDQAGLLGLLFSSLSQIVPFESLCYFVERTVRGCTLHLAQTQNSTCQRLKCIFQGFSEKNPGKFLYKDSSPGEISVSGVVRWVSRVLEKQSRLWYRAIGWATLPCWAGGSHLKTGDNQAHLLGLSCRWERIALEASKTVLGSCGELVSVPFTSFSWMLRRKVLYPNRAPLW